MIHQAPHVLEQEHHVFGIGIEIPQSFTLGDNLFDFVLEFSQLLFVHGQQLQEKLDGRLWNLRPVTTSAWSQNSSGMEA